MSVSGSMVEQETPGKQLWLVTFADLTAILVALFVLIFSMSAPFTGKGTGTQSGAEAETDLSVSNHAGDHFSQRTDVLADLTIGYLSAVLSDRGIARTGSSVGVDFAQGAPVTHHVESDRLILRLDPNFLFAPASKSMQPVGLDVVATLSDVLSNVANPVSIIAPVTSDDWTLAFDRADALVDAFRQTGYRAPVERFVSPGVPGGTLLVVVAHHGGGPS